MANILRMTRKRLGEILIEQGLLTPEQLSEALAEKKKTGELLGQILVRKEFISESDIARAQAIQYGVPYLPGGAYDINPEVASLFPLEFLERNQFVPLDIFGNVLVLAVSMPLDSDVLTQIERSTGRTLQIYVSTTSEVAQYQAQIADILDRQKAGVKAPAHPAPHKETQEAEKPAAIGVETTNGDSDSDDWKSLLKTVADADFIKELRENLDRVKSPDKGDEEENGGA